MTNKEVIRLIRNLPTMCEFTDAYGEPIDSDVYYEAVDIAISALQAQDVPDGDMVAIDTNGLDEEIRCEMCKNPMHNDRGCDGHCKYNEKLYEKIMQILNERIRPLPSAHPEIIRCKDCKWWSNDDYRECSSLNYDDGYVTPAGFYCGYAERRTDETD